jgi:hypothetical protein
MSTFLVSSPSYCRQAADANAGWHGGSGMNSALNSSIKLERFQASACPELIGWKPVRGKKTRQIKNLGPGFGSIETEGLQERPA